MSAKLYNKTPSIVVYLFHNTVYFCLMGNNLLYEPYTIHFETLDEPPAVTRHKHFFELVYIMSGTGRHCINEHSFAYGDNHMFLITPQDCSRFTIETTPVFSS